MRMLEESFEHAEADFEARLLIEARNEAEGVVGATEKSLRRSDLAELAADLGPGELDRIQSALAAVKQAIDGTDREAIRDRTRDLNDATRHLAEVIMNRSVRQALAGRTVDDVAPLAASARGARAQDGR
jgi:molecular chaperone DnaK/molecular chaperone HscA